MANRSSVNFITAVDEQNAQSTEDFHLSFPAEDGKDRIAASTVNAHSGNALPRIRASSRGNFLLRVLVKV